MDFYFNKPFKVHGKMKKLRVVPEMGNKIYSLKISDGYRN